MSIKYPKNERLLHSFTDIHGNLRYIITDKKIKDGYYLYELKGDSFVKLGKGKTPIELEKKYKFKQNLV